MRKFLISVDGNKYEVEVEELLDSNGDMSSPKASQSAADSAVSKPKETPAVIPEKKAASDKPSTSGKVGSDSILAPMPGTILKVLVTVGQSIKKNQVLCVLEAMKMENEIVAPRDGTVASVNVSKGSSVNSGDLLLSLE